MFSAASGTLITLATGLIVNTPTQLIGAVHYGFPVAWLARLVIAPEFFPWRVDYLGLVTDLFVWTAISGLVLLVLTRAKKRLASFGSKQETHL